MVSDILIAINPYVNIFIDFIAIVTIFFAHFRSFMYKTAMCESLVYTMI